MQFSYFFDYVRTSFFKKTRHQDFQHQQTQHGGREGEQEQVSMCSLETTAGDRQTKCLGGDRQWRRPDKLVCRSNSPSFCAAQVTSTCILGVLHRQMSSRTCTSVKDAVLCRARGKMRFHFTVSFLVQNQH
jgi:hypothetical protein